MIDNIVILENDLIEARFNEENGSLIGFENKKTGWKCQRREQLAHSFRLVVPLPERLLNILDGRNQKVMSIQESNDGSKITFVWENLASEYAGILDIRLEGLVTLNNSGLTFEMEIENKCPYTVESVAYPFIGDLGRPEAETTLKRANISGCDLMFETIYPTFTYNPQSPEHGYFGVEYPIQMVSTPRSPFVLIQGEKEGLYVGCHDVTAKERVEFTFQLKPGYSKIGHVPPGDEYQGHIVNTEFSVIHFPFVHAEETYELSPIVLKPYSGDWHIGVDMYKDWRKTWMRKPHVPKWLEEVHSWRQLQMSSWADTLYLKYNDLVEYGKECAKHDVKAIQLTGWTLYGQDGRLPNHDTDPRFGTREELNQAIRKIHEMGVKVVLYEKYTCTDISTEWYREKLYKYVSRDAFGNADGHGGWRYDAPAHLAGINTRPYAWMCMNSEDWQNIATDQIEKSLDLNPAGILLDECQWHGTYGAYCFDKRHGHRVPSYNFAGDAYFEKKAWQVLEKKDPELVLAGEACYDLQNRHYTLTYHRLRHDRTPVIRYIDPFQPMMSWVIGYDDRETINMCLMYRYIISYEPRHFRGKLEEFPLTLEYGKKVDALRKRYAAFLWDAEFQDTVGASVTSESRNVVYTVFSHMDSGKKAVVIANHGSNTAVATVKTEGTCKFIMVTPEEQEPRESNGTVHVPARSAAVLIEK